jgi:nucleoside-diphosphate-sugar epimerase
VIHPKGGNVPPIWARSDPLKLPPLAEEEPIITPDVPSPLRAALATGRLGDQPVFVCGLEKARLLLEWQTTIPVREGVGRLIRWMYDNKQLFGFN